MQAAPTRDGPRVNDEIRSAQVRLIDQEGEMQGVMTAREALNRAFSIGLDLLEISPNADPPVVKILDFGKFKYEQQKKKNEARKKQKIVEIKEVKVRPNIDENDYQVKLRAMKIVHRGGRQGQGDVALPGPGDGAPGYRREGARTHPRRHGPAIEGRADAADGEQADDHGALAALSP